MEGKGPRIVDTGDVELRVNSHDTAKMRRCGSHTGDLHEK